MLILAIVFPSTKKIVLVGQEFETDIALGEKIVRQLWVDLKEGNVTAIEEKIAVGFQSVHQDGARDRNQEIELVKGLNLGEYILSNFKISRNGPVIIASYFVTVKETIAGKKLPKKAAARMSIFLKTDAGWQWIAHANLNPLK